MKNRHRYNPLTRPPESCRKCRDDFFARADNTFRLLVSMVGSLPNVALFAKDADGRIVCMNAYGIELAGWRSLDDVLGYTSEELYEPDLAADYAARTREVLETGVPIVGRLCGNAADRSDALSCVSVYPVEDAKGRRIGTVTAYYRADAKHGPSRWYGPIRKAIAHLDRHLNENVTVEELAAISRYSVARFRKLFRAATQMSPSVYLQHARVNAAKTLLKTTDKLIADIAAETGFYDQPHFIRTFARITGLTPARFRRQFRE